MAVEYAHIQRLPRLQQQAFSPSRRSCLSRRGRSHRTTRSDSVDSGLRLRRLDLQHDVALATTNWLSHLCLGDQRQPRMSAAQGRAHAGSFGRYLEKEGGKIVIVGHSLGGLVGCALARNRPDLVRHVIAIGSPLRDGWQAVTPEVRPALFAIHTFFQKFIEAPQGCGTERCTCDFSEESRGTRLPSSVRFTSIYSRHDGVVDWRFATTENGDCYEVEGLHTDLVVNVEVYRILSNVLAGYPRRDRQASLHGGAPPRTSRMERPPRR